MTACSCCGAPALGYDRPRPSCDCAYRVSCLRCGHCSQHCRCLTPQRSPNALSLDEWCGVFDSVLVEQWLTQRVTSWLIVELVDLLDLLYAQAIYARVRHLDAARRFFGVSDARIANTPGEPTTHEPHPRLPA